MAEYFSVHGNIIYFSSIPLNVFSIVNIYINYDIILQINCEKCKQKWSNAFSCLQWMLILLKVCHYCHSFFRETSLVLVQENCKLRQHNEGGQAHGLAVKAPLEMSEPMVKCQDSSPGFTPDSRFQTVSTQEYSRW